MYVESKLAAYERDRPRSSFPHLYVSLVESFADAVVTSFVGSSPSEDSSRKTANLLKWLSMVGFISNGTEYNVSLGVFLFLFFLVQRLTLQRYHYYVSG